MNKYKLKCLFGFHTYSRSVALLYLTAEAKACCYCGEYAHLGQLNHRYEVWYKLDSHGWAWYKYIDHRISSQIIYREQNV